MPNVVKLRLKAQLRANFRVEAIAAGDSRNEIAEKNKGNDYWTETFPVQ